MYLLYRIRNFAPRTHEQISKAKSIFLSALLTTCSIGYSVNATAVSYNESVEKIRHNQASIKDYFLVCSICSDTFGGGDEKGYRFRESTLSKLSKSNHILNDTNTSPDENETLPTALVDIKHGYARLTLHDPDLEGGSDIFTMALFIMKDKTKFIAINEFYGGLDSDIYEYHFYRVESDRWVDRTSYVLKNISFADFAVDAQTRSALTTAVSWELNLPRFGTTALLQPHLRYGLSMEEFSKIKIRPGAMELLWEPLKGEFLKGKMVDASQWYARYVAQ